MRRWTHILRALMLVLMLWTSGIAQAAERFDCIPTETEVAGHYEGDPDQLPADSQQGAAHHHSGCSGHQIAAPSETAELIIGLSAATVPFAWREAGVPARGPDSLLRPPIA